MLTPSRRKTGSFDKIGFVSHFQGEVCSTLLVPSESALAASSLCCQYRFLHEKSFWAINECAWAHDVSCGDLRSVHVSKQGIHTGMDVVGTAFAILRVERYDVLSRYRTFNFGIRPKHVTRCFPPSGPSLFPAWDKICGHLCMGVRANE